MVHSDEEWATQLAGFFHRLNEIRIRADMDAMQQKMITVTIDNLATDIVYWFREAERDFNDWEELCELILKSDYGGSNDQSRKLASWNRAVAYTMPNGTVVNVMDQRRIARSRYRDLKAIMANLEAKQQRLINFCSLNKIEARGANNG